MRLIDITEFFKSLTDHESVSGILTKLSKQPTIDAVPVVRCRECKHWTGVDLGMRCKLYSFPPNCWICTGPDDFCSRGEKPETRK